MEKALPAIPAKRYFTIGEVSDLCGVKPHVLRYWEQEFTQLRPMKRRGNRRYYQHHEVLMIRRIRDLLYDQGFTISGARNKLQELVQVERDKRRAGEVMLEGVEVIEVEDSAFPDFEDSMPPEERVTTLTRIGRSLSYSVSEYGGAVSGTVTFSDRGLDKWRYDLTVGGEGYLTGYGEIKGDALLTEKKLEQPGRPMLVRDELKKVSRKHYHLQVEGMKPLPGTE